jgi:GR25 family glycosyltransferase involved in LPS biosynthesis
MSESTENIVRKMIVNYVVKREIIINDINKEIYINQNVQHIYVINLADDYIRRNYIKILMEKYKINFELIIVNRIQQSDYELVQQNFIQLGEYGCYLSHMYCLNDAIKNNYENIIIFEDDIIFHKKFHELFKNLMNNQKYKILMLGAADFHFASKNKEFIDKEKGIYSPSLKSTFLFTTHAIYYSKEGFKMMFDFRMKNIYHMDNNLVHFVEESTDNLYVCSPNLVVAELSTTNIHHTFWIGNKPALDEYYYRKCFNQDFHFHDYHFIYLELLKKITIDDKLSFKDNMSNCIEELFSDETIKSNIKERIDYHFFTNQDLLKIIQYNSI